MARAKMINDRYELDALPAGVGGMGEVYFGRDVKLDRDVAVKFVRFPYGDYDEELVRRFVRECRITARLEHPGVPAVYDVGTHDGRPFLVMQRIVGLTVSDLVAERGPLPISWASAIAAQACAVLSAAHAASLLHRDLKPANLMLEPDGGVKVLDFGLAVARLPEFSKITMTGDAQPGTTAYMAPEQLVHGVSGPASDLYSLGITLYEMLTGERLFQGDTAYAVMTAQVGQVPAPVSAVRPEVPDDLDRLLAALLQKDPAHRPADAMTVYRALLPHAHGAPHLPGVLAAPGAPAPRRAYACVVSRLFDVSLSSGVTGANGTPSPSAAVTLDQPAPAPRGQDEAPIVGPIGEEWADRLFAEARYDEAANAYAAVAKALDPASPSDAGYRCRLREATCRALAGQSLLALRLLQSLLDDQQHALAEDDDRTLQLRRQIGLLQLSVGQHEAAREGLHALLSDLVRLRGLHHPDVRQLRADLGLKDANPA